MKSATLVAALIAPVVVFGFLYVLLVRPQQEAADAAQHHLEAWRTQVHDRPAFTRRGTGVTPAAALRPSGVAGSLAALVNSPAVGGVTNLSIETGAAADAPRDLAYRPITVAFDASFEQIGRFFSSLRGLPAIELRSIELTPAPRNAMHLHVVFFAYQRRGPMQRRPQAVAHRNPDLSTPEAPPQPEPMVSSILFSSGRRVALVDGRVVRVGDRVGRGVVTEIEPEIVVITEGGHSRQLELERPIIRMARR